MSKKICKICYDAKRPGYSNHWMKDSSGNIICPYLANLKCLICGYTGHTKKYCKMPPKTIRSKPTLITDDDNIQKSTKKNINNLFELLIVDDDLKEEVVHSEKNITSISRRSWADIVDDDIENQLDFVSAKRSWADIIAA